MRTVIAGFGMKIPLGKQGENLATQVRIPVVKIWQTLYGQGTFQLICKRPTESTMYACSITSDDTNVMWNVTNTDVAIVGEGECELQYYVDKILAKSSTWTTIISDSLYKNEITPPEPWQSWVEDVLSAGSKAEQSAISAEQSATASNASAGQSITSATVAESYANAAKQSAIDSALSADNSAEFVHDAEAWAVGERNGTPVGTSDKSYDNNSKYYANRALKAEENIADGKFIKFYTDADGYLYVMNVNAEDDQSVIVDPEYKTTTEYPQMNDVISKYMSEVDYSDSTNDYSTTKVLPYYQTKTSYSKEEPAGLTIKVPANTALTVSQHTKSITTTVSGEYTIYNLIPNIPGTFSFGTKKYNILPKSGVRMIHAESVQNCRDIGGWACPGGYLKYGKIIRSGKLDNITNEDKSTFIDQLDVTVDIDLRNNSETGGITKSPLGDSVEYFHRSIEYYAQAVNSKDSSLLTMYAVQKAMLTVADGSVCVIHCSAGSDRTATVIYIIESLLGMSQSDKDKDYELSAFCNTADDQRFRSTNYGVATNGYYPLIKYFRDTYPSLTDNDAVLAWAINIGLTIDEINTFRRVMTEGTYVPVVDPTV